jgi:hypothetical protein
MVVTLGVTQAHAFWFDGLVVLLSLKQQSALKACKYSILPLAVFHRSLRACHPQAYDAQPGPTPCMPNATM